MYQTYVDAAELLSDISLLHSFVSKIIRSEVKKAGTPCLCQCPLHIARLGTGNALMRSSNSHATFMHKIALESWGRDKHMGSMSERSLSWIWGYPIVVLSLVHEERLFHRD